MAALLDHLLPGGSGRRRRDRGSDLLNRHQAVRPLLILPGGIYVTERDVSRFTLSPRTKARIQGMLMFLGFLLLCALASFDGVTPQ